MHFTPQITFRNFESSEFIESNIRKHCAKLEEFYNRIMGCRIIVEAPHHHHQQGNLYHVRIDLTVPGGELVINRDPPEHQAHDDIYVAIRDAFTSAERVLQDYARQQRGYVKVHEMPPHGQISALFPDEGYGFIEASDGHEVYFHPHSLLDVDFNALEVGQEVRFTEEEGDKGLQATTVRLIGKHHLHD